jgi:hypothetical protein
MKNTNKSEELQSRREFFKRAAKGALPIIAAVTLASVPDILRATEKDPMGCSYGSCIMNCSDNCYTTCRGTCQGSCTGYCTVTCKGSCSGSCY